MAKPCQRAHNASCSECKQRNYNTKEQKHAWKTGIEQVLPVLPQAYVASRIEIAALREG